MAEELIKVPDIGGAEGAEVVEVLVSPGERIDVEQSLMVVESDKASMEIPSPIAGVVGDLRVAVGDSVSEGDVILALATESGSEGADTELTHAEKEELDRVPQGDRYSGEHGAISTVVADDLVGAGERAASATSALNSDATSALEGGAKVIDVAIPDLGSDQGADLIEILIPVAGAAGIR